jgi:hypothetical protein
MTGEGAVEPALIFTKRALGRLVIPLFLDQILLMTVGILASRGASQLMTVTELLSGVILVLVVLFHGPVLVFLFGSGAAVFGLQAGVTGVAWASPN